MGRYNRSDIRASPGVKLPYITRTIGIAAATEKVLAILMDIDAYPLWQPAIEKAEVIERDPQGRPTLARLGIAVEGQTAICTILLSHLALNRFEYFVTESDVIRRNDASYVVTDGEDGSTSLVCNMGSDIAWDLPPAELDALAGRAVDAHLEALKTRAETS